MKKVLFIGFKGSSFCVIDEQILAKEFEVVPINIPANNSKVLLTLPFKVLRKIRRCDLVYIWFGSAHAAIAMFFARLFGKKAIIVAGGYDTSADPGYGLMSKRFMKFAPWYAFKKCDKVLAVSDFIRDEAIRIVGSEDKVVILPLGIDVGLFHDQRRQGRSNVMTVGSVTPLSHVVKGIDKFIRLARDVPDQRFVLVGRTDVGVKVEDLPNLEKPGFKVGTDLVSIYNDAKFYVQLSQREGFGMAVVEAMACGCIPVVTDRGALPYVVGDAGIVLNHDDISALPDIVRKGYDENLGRRARERVEKNFDLRLRETRLLTIVREMLKD